MDQSPPPTGDETVVILRGPSPHNLPAELNRFLGRETDLGHCEALLVEGRLLTVTGPGGGGKTRFALRLAQRALDRHLAGVWFVDLAPLSDPTRVPMAVVAALGVRERAGVPLTRALVDHLKDERALVVLDNCEHLIDACRALVEELRASCALLSILAVSREPLGLQGEQVYPLPPLSTPMASERSDPETLVRHASVGLFVDRAQRVAPNFTLDSGTAPAVKEICRAMDGLPLAIELAAARVKVLTVKEIASRLDRLLPLLRSQAATVTRRHATLRATLEWSGDALGPELRRAFRSLSVFAGGWSLPAAAAVLDLDELEALDAIDGLEHRSLLVADNRGEEVRYRYLEPVRQYAAEQLRVSGDGPMVYRRMVDHFVDLAQTAGPALIGPEQPRWLDRIALEHENVQAAIEACANLPAGAEPALRITGSLWRYWLVRGHLRAGADAVRRALAMPGGELAGLARAGALYAAGGLIAMDTGGQKGADEFFAEALAIYRAEGDASGMARCLTGLGAVTCARRDFAAGATHLNEAQELFRGLGDRRGLAATLNNLGAAAWNQGDLERAACSIGEALDLSRESGDLGNVAQLSVTLALINTRLGHTESARRHLRECLSTLGALGARHSSAAGALLASAELATREGRFPDSARWLGAADEILEHIGLVLDESDVWWKERGCCWNEARSQLGEEGAAAEYRAGRAIDSDQALGLALASLDAFVEQPTSVRR